MEHAARIWGMTIAVTALQLAGCGGDTGPTYETAKVSGTVQFDGKPMTAGRVMFQNETGPAETVPINGDGTYSVELAVGETRVAVEHRAEAETGKLEGRPEMPFPGKSLIPEKYSTFTSSGLKLTVKGGEENKYDIKLDP